MKFWLTFGSGVVMGAILGAFMTSFFLFDDVSKSPSYRPPTVVAKPAVFKTKKGEMPVVASSTQSTPEAKPHALPAEAVDLEALPPSAEVLSTAKREDTSINP